MEKGGSIKKNYFRTNDMVTFFPEILYKDLSMCVIDVYSHLSIHILFLHDTRSNLTICVMRDSMFFLVGQVNDLLPFRIEICSAHMSICRQWSELRLL